MPTIKKRIAMAVPDDLDNILTALSRLTGSTKTGFILGLLEQMKPVLEVTLALLQEVKQGRTDSAISHMQKAVKAAGKKLDEAQEDLFQVKKASQAQVKKPGKKKATK
jgi:predicted DNA-binding protein